MKNNDLYEYDTLNLYVKLQKKEQIVECYKKLSWNLIAEHDN